MLQQTKDKKREIEAWERQQTEKQLLEEKQKQDKLIEKIQRFEKRETQPAESRANADEAEFQELEVEHSKFNLIMFNRPRRKRQNIGN